MGFSYSTTVYRQRLQSEFQVGGQGYRWLDKVRLQMHLACVAGAPARSGVLKASHRSYISGINQWAARANIVNTAEHAEWVHEGTAGGRSGIIEPVNDDFLWVPIAPMAWKRKKMAAVSGQDPNPWMEDACDAIAMGHGAVRYL